MSDEPNSPPPSPSVASKPVRRKKRRVSVPAASATAPAAVLEKPTLPPLDALEAAQEEARHAKEGAHKLGRALETLRLALETVAVAEWDHTTGKPVTATELRGLAIAALDAYSQQIGQNWRSAKLIGNRAGTTGNAPVHEREM